MPRRPALGTPAAVLCAGMALFAPLCALGQPAQAAPADSDSAAPQWRSPEQAAAGVYQLAAQNDLAGANRAADQAVLHFADSPTLWEAAGYVRRGAADYARALEAYQNAGRLDPANLNAWRGQVLMLQRLGALAPAASLLEAHPELKADPEMRSVPGQMAAEQLRFAQSLEDATERRQRVQGALTRLDELIAGAGGELAAAQAGEPAVFDRLQAYVLLGREDLAAQHYETLASTALSIPGYARLQAAIAYARLGRSAPALAILGPLAQEQPDDVDIQLELFYALVDADRVAQAREVVDRLLERLRSGADRDARLRVQIAAAMARAYDEHDAEALARLNAALDETPSSAQARSARAIVYDWRGWPRRARGQAQAVLADAPRNRDARALQVQTDMALDNWAQARAHLDEAAALDALSERDRQQLGERLHWHERPQLLIESGFGTGSRTAVVSNRDWQADARAYTAPIDGRYRVFGHLRQSYTDLSPAAELRTWGGLGLEALWPGTQAALELAGVSGEAAPAARLQSSWQPADGARLALTAATSDPETPARASAAGIRVRSALLSGSYDFNESTGLGVDLGAGRYSDGNRQLNLTARVSQRLFATNLGKLTWNNYLGLTRDSLDAALAPYFDPSRASSEETELRAQWLGGRDARRQRVRWHIVSASIGSYQQSGYATRPILALRYEQRWVLSDHSEFGFGVGASRHPYDGRAESRLAISLNYEGRL